MAPANLALDALLNDSIFQEMERLDAAKERAKARLKGSPLLHEEPKHIRSKGVSFSFPRDEEIARDMLALAMAGDDACDCDPIGHTISRDPADDQLYLTVYWGDGKSSKA